MTDAEAIAILDLLPQDDGQALALVLAAYVERRKAECDMLALARVHRWALEVVQTRRIDLGARHP